MSERSLVELIDRVRKERGEAFERASLFARYADDLENALQEVITCGGGCQCGQRAVALHREACRKFTQEWRELQDVKE